MILDLSHSSKMGKMSKAKEIPTKNLTELRQLKANIFDWNPIDNYETLKISVLTFIELPKSPKSLWSQWNYNQSYSFDRKLLKCQKRNDATFFVCKPRSLSPEYQNIFQHS